MAQSKIAETTRRRMKLIDRAIDTLWSDPESRELCLEIRFGDPQRQQEARQRVIERAKELGIDYLYEIPNTGARELTYAINHVVNYSFRPIDCGVKP